MAEGVEVAVSRLVVDGVLRMGLRLGGGRDSFCLAKARRLRAGRNGSGSCSPDTVSSCSNAGSFFSSFFSSGEEGEAQIRLEGGEDTSSSSFGVSSCASSSILSVMATSSTSSSTSIPSTSSSSWRTSSRRRCLSLNSRSLRSFLTTSQSSRLALSTGLPETFPYFFRFFIEEERRFLPVLGTASSNSSSKESKLAVLIFCVCF
mmetsp:Transcript_14072/g.21104  ORF Transcript_14072/g.21104 Transcript_14072/m.21104 type:complete len:204 (+) Transcript_14072:164-775(+)